jgi:hypothetical protein
MEGLIHPAAGFEDRGQEAPGPQLLLRRSLRLGVQSRSWLRRRSLGCQLIVDGASLPICSAIRAWDAHSVVDHPLTSPQIHCCHWNLTRSKRGLGEGGELDFFWNSRLPAGRDQSGAAWSPKECYCFFKL